MIKKIEVRDEKEKKLK